MVFSFRASKAMASHVVPQLVAMSTRPSAIPMPSVSLRQHPPLTLTPTHRTELHQPMFASAKATIFSGMDFIVTVSYFIMTSYYHRIS